VNNNRIDQQPIIGGYWNEYDYGSEGGDFDHTEGGYVIYVDPNPTSGFSGLSNVYGAILTPLTLMRSWFANRRPPAGLSESDPLLPANCRRYGSADPEGYFTTPPGASLTDTDVDDENETLSPSNRRGSYGSVSSEEFPAGYQAHYAALPSVNEQMVARYREQVLFWGLLGSFGVSAMLLGIAALLINTGRHRLRAEVDAGVVLSVVASLGFSCAALGMTMARRDPLGWVHKLAILLTFTATCVLNGVLLVLVVGNSAL
jgi:hypothetical protein